jgi:hypothetical protein
MYASITHAYTSEYVLRVRALRETETETETDRFSINQKPTVGRFSKISVFGFPDSGLFCLLGCLFSRFFLHTFCGKFFLL